MGLPTRLVAPLALLAFCGCVLPHNFVLHGDGPAAGVPQQVVVAWSNRVTYVPDPSKGGAANPGIAGMVYLFGAVADVPMIGDGSLIVDLYDDTPVGGKANSVMIERWHFDPVALKKLASRDTIGPCYTIFLPWGSYKPDRKTVHLQVKYEPANGGSPILAPSGPLSLDHGATPTGR